MHTLMRGLMMVLVMGWMGCGAAPEAATSAKNAATAPAQQESSMTKQFLMKTSMGDLTLELDYTKAPKTCANFEQYVASGHYNGTIFHRVIAGFMIQGGGMDSTMKEKSTLAPIENEAANGLKNLRGTIAMARTNAVHSATSQFFINVVDNAFLNHRSPDPQGFGYCVFGHVVSGMETVDAIRAVATGTKGMHRDVPNQPVLIQSVTLVEKAE
jgi:peptidyl-prolyl cis-trans isomerase B (cyclophilin B)